ncbi:MAG: Calx-beta domain-containing protein, partial [bacterium]
YYMDNFYRIRINGSTNYYTNNYAYSLEYVAGGYPESSNLSGGPREWFMCANAYGTGPYYLHSFTISGTAQVDDYCVSSQSAISLGNADVFDGPASTTTNMVFTVSISGPEGADVPVKFETVDGTALAGVDYAATSGVVMIPSGQTSTSIVVIVNGDGTKNGTRDFTVNFSRWPWNPAVLGSGIGTIYDDDDATPGYTVHGTPHLWLEYYSLTNGGYETADTNDSDGDGTTEWQEYWAGTVPTNRESVFKIVSVTTNFTITWMGGTNNIAGTPPPWVVHRATNLIGDPGAVWTNLPSTNIDRNPYLLDSTNSRWTDPDGGIYTPKLFYRITTTTNAH